MKIEVFQPERVKRVCGMAGGRQRAGNRLDRTVLEAPQPFRAHAA